jgi:hypothetical protein
VGVVVSPSVSPDYHPSQMLSQPLSVGLAGLLITHDSFFLDINIFAVFFFFFFGLMIILLAFH